MCLHFFLLFVCWCVVVVVVVAVARVSTGVFFVLCAHVLRAHAVGVVHGHCLYPGAVLPVRSQVFISLDNRRQITRPRAAAHPSFQGLPKTAFNMHYSFPCCYKPNFQQRSIGFSLMSSGCSSAGSPGVATSAELHESSGGTTPLWIHALNDTVPCAQCSHFLRCADCHLKLVSPELICIFVNTSQCVVMSESVWWCVCVI